MDSIYPQFHSLSVRDTHRVQTGCGWQENSPVSHRVPATARQSHIAQQTKEQHATATPTTTHTSSARSSAGRFVGAVALMLATLRPISEKTGALMSAPL